MEAKKMKAQKIEEQHTTNGVNVGELFSTIDAVKKSPVIAKFKFRADNQWFDGGYNETTIKDFYGIQKEHRHEAAFTLGADEPPLLLGTGKGPNPVEYLLTALAACVTTSLVYHAAAKGIKLNSVESRIEGDIDLQGFLGLSEEIRNGFQEIRMKFKIDADVPAEQLEELIQLGPTYSPVFDSITKGVPVSVQLDK